MSPASGEPDVANRWIPALAITSGLTFQKQDGGVSSRCLLNPPGQCYPAYNADTRAPLGPRDLRPSDQGASDLSVGPFVGGSLQLMTPTIPLPGGPRLFVAGEYLPTFSVPRDIAKEGSATRPTRPPARQAPGPTFFSELEYEGIGSKTTSKQRAAWGAGLGVALPFELRGRQMRLKASAAWIRYELDISGRVSAGIKDDQAPQPPGNDPDRPDLGRGLSGAFEREVILTGSDSLTLDGIGPGLEIEMDALRWGPLGASIFVGANAYRVLGKRAVQFSTRSAVFPATPSAMNPRIPADQYEADWSFEAKPWLYRIGLGVRFHWFGR